MADIVVTEAANYVPEYDLSDFNLDQVEIASATGSVITAVSGEFTVTFQGSFSYDRYGIPYLSSTASSISLSYGNELVLSISGLNLSFGDLLYMDLGRLEEQVLEGDDTFTSAWNYGETIWTHSGNDRIQAGTGDDTVYGGAGYDTFFVDAPDTYWRTYFDYDGAVVFESDHGADRLYSVEAIALAGYRIEVQQGSSGADWISGRFQGNSGGFDMINGWGGDDTISGGASDDFMFGGSGDDRLYGFGSHDDLFGEDGDDLIFAGSGRDKLRGGNGSDRLFGVDGDDTVWGDSGDDTLGGGNGDDSLNGGSGDDELDGSNGKDRLAGGLGSDELRGGNGDDRVIGGAGADTVIGGSGHDVLIGGKGRDVLLGHAGDDRLTGGSHQDVFVFHRGQGNDTITDFQIGTDLIEIGRGASRLGQLEFEQQGEDVLISFADVTVLVENTEVAALRDADNFLF